MIPVVGFEGKTVAVFGLGPVGQFCTRIAKHKGYRVIGVDLVHACVNDILVSGADPLFLLEATGPLGGVLGGNGREFFRRHYSWPVIERKYLDMFERLPTPFGLVRAGVALFAVPAGAASSRSAAPRFIARDSFSKARTSICRTRSRLMLNS